jgi:large subunit ribosomal protein L22
MPKFGYSVFGLDPDRTAKASGREVAVSPKAAREVCKAIRGMWLSEAKEFLEAVIEKKKPVPYFRYKKEVPHRHGLEGWYAGKYPVKAAQEILRVLEGVEANAENRELDLEKLRVIHAAAQRARKIKKFMPRAFGRSSPRFEKLAHVEIVVLEEATSP